MKQFLIVFCGILCFAGVLTVCNWVGEANQVAQEEFGARGSLRKYEWFKNAAAQLEKKSNDIQIKEAQIDSFKKDYEGTKRSAWPRDDRETFRLYSQELAGMKASYNGLVAEYNASSKKFNWDHVNEHDLPTEFTTYVSE